ncbi:hypothetical protein SAMN02745823_01723 [Sporobacter termitidis DSM 10068]|uniref:GLUG domain-containing protein n=1 Tax=Sporobacter termitidis DSM 10068 TaxID=1123282 RepID=A0A1M5XE81_9FIRM|nr:hypothetical protein [Sporobacter termitidis]SHH97804.1 hypothetical protein SAMN02745823_01723 [Sporobacter termitidis DSM 10068]
MIKTYKRKALSVVFALALIVSLVAGLAITASAADYTMSAVNTNGTNCANGDVVSISSPTELGYFATYVNTSGKNTQGVTFYLTGNIALSGSWTPVGIATVSTDAATSSPYISAGAGFAGTFDGGGYTISGLSVSLNQSGVGLFKYLAPTGMIVDLTVSGSVTTTGSYDAIGGVVGYNSGIINNVTSNVTVSATSAYNVGGIAGFNNSYFGTSPQGIIVNSRNTAAVTGMNKVGGITGENAGTISSCSNSAKIDGTNASSKNGIGGIAGRNGNNNTAVETGKIIDCFNAGEVGRTGQKWVGGITGFQNALSSVYNTVSTGNIVTGSGFDNPTVGQNEGTTTYGYCLDTLYYTGGTDAERGIPKTATELKDAAFVTTLNTYASRTTAPYIWAAVAGNYPALNYNAAVPSPSGGGSTNNYAVIYLSSSGSDSNAGNTSGAPVQTLRKAVELAGKSTNPSVYVSVMNTITVSNAQSVFGSDTDINWDGSTGPMFSIASGGNLTIGGLNIDGDAVTTAFNVASGGALTLRNNASISDCGTAVNVAGGGSLTANYSSISGSSYSVYLASSTSVFTMYASTSQTITLSGTVYLATGAYIRVGSALTSDLTVSMGTSTVGTVVAQRTGTYTFSGSDVSKFHYGAHTFTTASGSTRIAIAS